MKGKRGVSEGERKRCEVREGYSEKRKLRKREVRGVKEKVKGKRG